MDADPQRRPRRRCRTAAARSSTPSSAAARDGTFTGLRVRLVGDGGAYPGIGAFLPAGTKRMANGTYRFPAIQFDVAVAVTNTTPMGAYRGAGRPEATALLERLVDHAALELGIDPIELRRRNFLADDVFPFTTLTGVTYDTGRYNTPLDAAAEAIGYAELRARAGRTGASAATGSRSASASPPTSRSPPAAAPSEFGAVEVHDDGSATVRAGTFAHGQGHQTAFAMLVNDQTGIPVDRIRLVDGDTDLVPTRRRHGRLALAAARRLGGAPGDRGCSSRRPSSSPPTCSRPTSPTSSSTPTPARSAWPACRPRALSWAELARRAAEAPAEVLGDGDVAGRARRRGRLRPGRRDVPVRRPHRRRRGRPRHRARSASCATSPSTTAARCSTRCSSRASSTAASPPASARRCTRRSATTPTATR